MDDVPSSGPEFFDIRYAAGRMPWDYGGVQNSLKAFLSRHHEPGRVLIPGCGSGYEIEAFFSTGWDVIGIDYSPVGVARARRLLGPLADKVYEGDFFTYPLGEASFDLIYGAHLSVHAVARCQASVCPTACYADCPIRHPLWIFLSRSRRGTTPLSNHSGPTG